MYTKADTYKTIIDSVHNTILYLDTHNESNLIENILLMLKYIGETSFNIIENSYEVVLVDMI